MRKFCKDLFTGIDGTTFDIGRVGTGVAIVTYVFATFYTLHQGKPFDWLNFGGGFGAILAGSGVGIGLKAKTEPGSC